MSMKPNPDYKSATYRAVTWTPEKGIRVIKTQPKIADGRFSNADGAVRFVVKSGKLAKQ